MAKNKRKKSARIALCIVSSVVLVLVFSYFAVFTNGFSTAFNGFLIKVDGDYLLSNGAGYLAYIDDPLEIKTLSVLGPLESSVVDDCQIDIHVNENIKFEYYVDGNLTTFNDDVDWSSAFEVKKNRNGFSITPKAVTLEELFWLVYDTEAVRFLDVNYHVNNMFVATISKDDKNIDLYFSVSDSERQVVLDSEEIIF